MNDGRQTVSPETPREDYLETVSSLYDRYATEILRMSYFYLGNYHSAEDVCSKVFLRLIEKQPVLEKGSELAWLCKVARNLCFDHWRSTWVKRVALGSPVIEMIPALETAEGYTEKREIIEAVYKLPVSFREIFILHYYQGFGIAEMSRILDLPEGTISSRLSRGRKKLQSLLEGGESR